MRPQSTFTLHPSRRLTLLYPLLVAVALVPLWTMPLSAMLAAPLSLIVLAWGAYRLLFDARLRGQDSCVAFRLGEDDAIVLVQRSGRHIPGRILAGTFVTPLLVILNVAPEGSRRVCSLVLASDCMGSRSFRRLRVALRWGGRPDQSGR